MPVPVLAWVLGRNEPGGVAEGGPARDPDVEAVCPHQGQLALLVVLLEEQRRPSTTHNDSAHTTK